MVVGVRNDYDHEQKLEAVGILVWAMHGVKIRLGLVLGLALLAGCAERLSAPTDSQSACPNTISDADRLACLISIEPEPAPTLRKPSPLLRNSEGTIIGPKPSQ